MVPGVQETLNFVRMYVLVVVVSEQSRRLYNRIETIRGTRRRRKMLPKTSDMVPEVDKTPDLVSIPVFSVVLCEQSGRPSKCKLLDFMK